MIRKTAELMPRFIVPGNPQSRKRLRPEFIANYLTPLNANAFIPDVELTTKLKED